jgi:radical SAM protein with 4Fe4S-binding SPASM domain
MIQKLEAPPAFANRAFTTQERRDTVPFMMIWEMTLACNLKCGHCGSRAGKRRPDELSTEEALDMITQMRELGARELCIIGGEAHLRKDWLEIIRHTTSLGMYCGMQTGGYNLSFKKLQQAREAGLRGIGLSIDGLEELHDRVRGVKGSFEHAIRTIRYARELGMRPGVNTQVGAHTAKDLPGLVDMLLDEKVNIWRCQLTAPMGNAVDNDDLLIQPYELKEVMPLIGRLYEKARANGMECDPCNSLGYFGPTEPLLRPDYQWSSCCAGQTAIAFEANGNVKSCPGLATADFTAGNIRENTLKDIWRHSDLMHWARLSTTKDLWGFCGTCYYKEACYAGCAWMAHSMFGKTGNNPWCEYRVNELWKRGLRERLVKIKEAAGDPFAVGEFSLVLEPIPGGPAEGLPPVVQNSPKSTGPLVQIQLGVQTGAKTQAVLDRSKEPPPGKVVKRVKLCPACNQNMLMREDNCPWCGQQMPEWRSSASRRLPPVTPETVPATGAGV